MVKADLSRIRLEQDTDDTGLTAEEFYEYAYAIAVGLDGLEYFLNSQDCLDGFQVLFFRFYYFNENRTANDVD